MVPQYARRHHRKSKSGCIPCKARHTKCDELKPICSGCIRHETSCVYRTTYSSSNSTTPSSKPDHSASSSTPTSTTSISVPTQPMEQNSVNDFHALQLKDLATLKLFHHYTTVTYLTLSHQSSHLSIWQEIIPQLALQCPFLMHGLLSIAALHLASLYPVEASQYLFASTRNQDLALPAFREALNSVNEANGQQVFCFSALLTVLAIGSQSCSVPSRPLLPLTSASEETYSSRSTQEPSGAVESILEWFRLLRGLQPIMEAVGELVKNSPLGPMLENPQTLPDHGFALNQMDVHLEALTTMFTNSKLDTEDLEAYRETLHQLRRAFAVALLPNLTINVRAIAFAWPVTLPKRFVTLLEHRKPEAMVFLAYYAVFLLKMDSIWYIRGSAARILDLCKRSLDEEGASWTRSWMEYPTLVINQAQGKHETPAAEVQRY